MSLRWAAPPEAGQPILNFIPGGGANACYMLGMEGEKTGIWKQLKDLPDPAPLETNDLTEPW